SSGSAPPISAAISAPVAGARTTPAPSWPQACHRPLTRGSGPITGRWSGTNGRYPWYARTTRTRARNGNSATACAASRRSTAEEYAGSKPTRSRLDPISTVPARVGATTAAVVVPAWSLATWSGYSAAYTRRRIGGASRASHQGSVAGTSPRRGGIGRRVPTVAASPPPATPAAFTTASALTSGLPHPDRPRPPAAPGRGPASTRTPITFFDPSVST